MIHHKGKFLAFLLFCLVVATGCVQEEVRVTPAPLPTLEIRPPDLSPLPTDTVPSEYRIFVTVSRNTYSFNPLIRVEFRGGQGMALLSSLDAEVMRGDATIGTARLEKPAIGEYMEIAGTTGKDRVVVTATMMNGERYRVYDQVLEFRA